MTKIQYYVNIEFVSFNELIAEKWDGHYAVIKLVEVVERMIKKGLNRKEVFSRGWLNIEDVYESYGWNVRYDKPGWSESYLANFVFNRKPKA